MFWWQNKCKRLILAVFGPLNNQKWSFFLRLVCFRESQDFASINTFQFLFYIIYLNPFMGLFRTPKLGLVFIFVNQVWPPETHLNAKNGDFLAKNDLKIVTKKWPKYIFLSFSLILSQMHPQYKKWNIKKFSQKGFVKT